jgi:DNA-binding MarR family transcriptional regulator
MSAAGTARAEVAHTSPSLLLDRAADRVSSAVQKALTGSRISLEKWRVLDLLADSDGMTMSDIAAAVLVTGPTLTRIVDQLATSALVHRDVDMHDRRRVLVHLTPRGRRLRRSLLPAVQDAETQALAALTGPQTATLTDLLERLAHP